MKIVFFTGAGVSAESGIPTYRDKGGIWDKYDPNVVCSIQGWNKNPKNIINFFDEVKEGIIGCEPNEAHKLIAGLESNHEVTIITQNIDNLHEKAGSTNVIHLHGELFKDKVTTLGTRPDVVLFGEDIKRFSDAIQVTKKADIFVIIGTSLNVYPASSIVSYTKNCKKYFIDPVPANFPEYTLIPMSACDGMKYFVSLI